MTKLFEWRWRLLNIMMKSEFIKVNFFFLAPNFRDTNRLMDGDKLRA